MRSFLIFLGFILAWSVLGIGLISPLTPSEGMPSLANVLIFVGLPLLIFFVLFLRLPRSGFRLLAALQAVVLALAAGWLLLMQAGLINWHS